MKDYILRIYDGKRLEKRLKDSYEVVDNPALTILGITVDATFHQCIDPESLVDGLMQRFNFLIASPGKSAGALWRISEQIQPAGKDRAPAGGFRGAPPREGARHLAA
ncbi:DUF3987 domain-containing protein [Azospirillum sp. B21]|nr:DUF3987 domain-containing protein [Azospirillum sp. B21]